MFNFDKKVVIIILMSCSLGNIVNSITGNFIKIYQIIFYKINRIVFYQKMKNVK